MRVRPLQRIRVQGRVWANQYDSPAMDPDPEVRGGTTVKTRQGKDAVPVSENICLQPELLLTAEALAS